MEAVLAAVVANLTPVLATAASLVLARFLKIVPDPAPAPSPDAVDAEIVAFQGYIAKAGVGLVRLDSQDKAALGAVKSAVDAILSAK